MEVCGAVLRQRVGEELEAPGDNFAFENCVKRDGLGIFLQKHREGSIQMQA
jgi:hypothetical protein